MNKKIIATLIVLLFCVSCFGFVSADNITNETIENNETEVLDMSNYIRPVSISGNEIEFSDGFTGFCLDLTKDAITADDGFISEPTGSSEIQNYVKLAIIEAYRQGSEGSLGQIISSFADGSYASSNDKVITEVLKSQETVGDSAVVELEDSTEGTFEFELLKDANGVKSDCLAYKVSLKEVPAESVLGAAANNTTEETNDTTDAVSNSTDNTTEESVANQTENTNETPETIVNQTESNNVTPVTIVNQTNETVVNETTNVIINNTTIKQNNTKIINVTKETPQNTTVVTKLMKTAGNPIFILIVVIAIIAVAGIYMRKKG